MSDKEFLSGLDFGDLEVSFVVTSDGILQVIFGYPDARSAWENFKNGSPSGEEFIINSYVHEVYYGVRQEVLQELAEKIQEASLAGKPYRRVEYVGYGVAACVAVMVATVSPPRAVIAYDMPPFCSANVWEAVEKLCEDKAARMLEMGFPAPIAKTTFRNYECCDDVRNSPLAVKAYWRIGHSLWLDYKGRQFINPSSFRRLFSEFMIRVWGVKTPNLYWPECH